MAARESWLCALAVLLAGAVACGSGDSGDDASPSDGDGCTAQPACGDCQGCFATCMCHNGDSAACAQACGAPSSGGAGGSGATGGSGIGGTSLGGTGGQPSGGTGGGAGSAAGTSGTVGVGGAPSTGGVGGTSGSGATGGTSATPPAYTPVYRISVRLHTGQSTLPQEELRAVLEEVNHIWLSQAGVCFEFHTVNDDVTQATGFDFWFVPEVPDPPGVNGVYKGDHDIWSRDYPNLGSAPNPVTHPAARTGAHEIGHGLTLNHYNGYGDDSNDSLMSSGRLGWKLSNPNLAGVREIDDARARAQQKALSDTTPLACGAPVIN